MNLLEQALARTKSTVIEEKDGITIDKSFAFASRKRGRVALSTVSENIVQFNDKPSSEMDRPSAEAVFWREKFYTMKREQEEKDVKLQQQLNLHKEKEKVLNECINLLTAKLVKSNQNESTSCQSNLKTNEIEIDGDKPEVEGPAAKVAKLEKVITSYQRITGISIKVQDPQGAEDEVLVCTAKNSNRRLLTRFLLTKEMSNDEIILIPEANIHLLPIYLQEGASFLPALAPLLMGDILVSLFAENDATV